jgi:CheY-like chemotaxis protein
MSASKLILLAEDNPHDAELILYALADHPVSNEVVVAHNGVEALDYLFRQGAFIHRAELDPALVLLDLNMPKVDGLEVLQKLKADEQLKTIPAVMMSSSRLETDLARSYELGANAYVVKPVEFPRFVDTIKQIANFWAFINEPPPAAARMRTQPAERHYV